MRVEGPRRASKKGRPPDMKAWRSVLIGLLLAHTPGMLSAQKASITGQVLDSDFAGPVQGVLVTLIGAAGNPVQSRLSNALGRYRFTDVDPGEYSVTANMIGYGTTTSRDFSLAPGKVHILDLTVEVTAIILGGLAVSGERRCGLDPNEGIILAQLWSEVREALQRASFTGGLPFVYETRSITRRMTRNASGVIDVESTPIIIASGVPYVSLDPEVFRERGYAFRNDTTNLIDYYAPDADVLLSDAFTDTHCFQLERGEDEEDGLVGVKFEPLDGRDIPEIQGVAWVDPGTIKLRHVEFQFVNVLRGSRQKHLGGRMDFVELPSGLWIIEVWRLRVPVVSQSASDRWGIQRRRFRPADLLAIQEFGGVVDRVRDAAGEPVFDAHAGLVRGIVVDSETGAPAPGIIVTLGDTGRLARTGASGVFRFGDVPEAMYRITFQDAAGVFLGEVAERPTPGIQTFIRFVISR
jgi:Carboxypeptidase regulatory-like domain